VAKLRRGLKAARQRERDASAVNEVQMRDMVTMLQASVACIISSI
jgi:hypothetical protein